MARIASKAGFIGEISLRFVSQHVDESSGISVKPAEFECAAPLKYFLI
jgi:hypothetical protein